MDTAAAKAAIAVHCARYPLLQPTDLLKFLHQSVFGCGHLITDPAVAADWLAQEMDRCADGGEIEPLDGSFCRVPLGYLKALGVSPVSFAALFALSARKEGGTVQDLELRLAAALDMTRDGLLPFSCEALSAAIEGWRTAGFPAQHHSEDFRAAYAPAYRVLHQGHAALLPLMGRIDRLLSQKGRAVVAIEGRAGSGKSTLASLLQSLYGCTVLHMDDFFLRPEQRTAERYAAPGGNIDHERFAAEALPGLQAGRTFRYRPFDCATFTVDEGTDITPAPLTVVEGSYSLHPALGEYHDCAVFLTVEPAEQRRRIKARNPAFAERFFDTWIPLEEAYFAAFHPEQRCDFTMEVGL